MTLKKYLILFLIVALAATIRLWNLPNNPPGLTWDEAALGYNAYSLLQTGKDEYGQFLPLNLKSFGDFKPALYAYLDIPFVAIFGLNELAVRLPSAIFGILGVFGVFLLVNQLFKNQKLAYFAAFFLAISPWHIQFSRPAFEANAALTFNIFAVYFFIKGLNQKRWLIFSSLSFGLSLITYQASKVFIPILILSLLIIYKRNYKIKSMVASSLILVVFLGIMMWTFLSGQTGRLQSQNFFAYRRSLEDITQISKEDGLALGSLPFEVFHGDWWAYTKGLAERYLIYFSPKMLFIDGDYSKRQSVPDLGSLYYFSVILIPLGAVYFIRLGTRGSKFLWFWLLLAPIPAVFSRDLISTLRALNMVLPWAILEAGGLYLILSVIKKLGIKWIYFGVIIIIALITTNFLIYLDRYFIHAQTENSRYWLYGYSEVFTDLAKNKDKYKKIVVTDFYSQPYVYFLFYNKYNPSDFQKQAVLDQPTVDVGTVRKIDNIEFRHISWPQEREDKNSLFIGTLEELPDRDILPFQEFNLIKDIKFLNGEVVFRVVETK